MKRLAIFITVLSLLFSTSIISTFASISGHSAPVQKKVMFYLKPDVTVEMNGVRHIFKDARGQIVYPIIYNGSAYLPVRAMSALMKELKSFSEKFEADIYEKIDIRACINAKKSKGSTSFESVKQMLSNNDFL
jgi:hypothetical protein